MVKGVVKTIYANIAFTIVPRFSSTFGYGSSEIHTVDISIQTSNIDAQ